MRKIKEVLRLRFELGMGQRQIARSCSIGQATVSEYLGRPSCFAALLRAIRLHGANHRWLWRSWANRRTRLAACLGLLVSLPGRGASPALTWFCPPDPPIGNQEYMSLFMPDAVWPKAASHVQVFKIYFAYLKRGCLLFAVRGKTDIKPVKVVLKRKGSDLRPEKPCIRLSRHHRLSGPKPTRTALRARCGHWGGNGFSIATAHGGSGGIEGRNE